MRKEQWRDALASNEIANAFVARLVQWHVEDRLKILHRHDNALLSPVLLVLPLLPARKDDFGAVLHGSGRTSVDVL